MSYNRVHGDDLRFYADSINWLFSKGVPRTEWEDKNTGDWSYNSGSYDNKYTLVDQNPLRKASFNLEGDDAHVMHQIDLQATSAMPINFLKIMNHNGADASAGFRLAYNTSAFTNPGDGTTIVAPVAVLNGSVNPDSGANLAEALTDSETAVDVTDGGAFSVGEYLLLDDQQEQEVIKITAIAVNTLTVTRGAQGTNNVEHNNGADIYRYGVIKPTNDGETILTFTEVTDKRYWCIETIPIQTGGAGYQADLDIGCYMLGKYHTMTMAPDLSVKPGFLSDGVTNRKTVGGKDFTFGHYLSSNDAAATYAPYRYNLRYYMRPNGRQTFNLTWKGMADTNIYPQDLSAIGAGGDFFSDVINKVGINFLSFTLALDKDSSDEGDYLFCKFDQSSFDTTQKAWQWSGFSLRIIQQY